jgi:ornithine cyclodeaminase/alanine dehydrogenase-like protein (mu-crystallin family)
MMQTGKAVIQDPPRVLVLSRRDIAALMRPADWLAAVERGFRAGVEGTAVSPMPMHIPAEGGGFHAKGAAIDLGRRYVALKFNGNFPGNPSLRGLPTIQGALILSDGENGSLLALMDTIEVTLRRTAAASALAARLLARPDSQTLLICGCGEQGRAHLEALADVLPLKRCLAWDADPERASAFEGTGAVDARAVCDLEEAVSAADVIATCTTAREAFLGSERVRPGTFIAAVGADSPDKRELGPELMAAAAVVTDVTAQCAAMGELHHLPGKEVRAELGALVTGVGTGRMSHEEIIVFDSTGTALQDVAAAAAIYEKAVADSSVSRVALGVL